MALADPQSITINGVTTSLPRTEVDVKRAAYVSNDENLRMDVSHQDQNKRVRSLTKVTSRKVAADPITAVNTHVEASLQLVLDRPKFGFSLADLEHLRAGFLAKLTPAFFAQLFGQES